IAPGVSAENHPAKRRGTTIGAVARLVQRKDISTLIRAWEIVRSDRLAADWRLEIVGDGPLRSEIEALARSTADSVMIRGARTDARALIAEFDVLVLPSLREGLPLVLLEAMAAGTPVVSSDLPGCRAALGD